MAIPAPNDPIDLSRETIEARDLRLVWERERIAEAEDDFANGRYIGGQEAIDWLDRWAAGEELEEPEIG